jgi:bacterioferritin-associated ferredoxin
MINIDSCYCEQKTFAALIAIAHANNLDLIALSEREGCGTHCGWCVAYLRRGLQTGETAFHELLDKEPLKPDSDDAAA